MNRFAEIKFRSGNAELSKIINIDSVADFSPEKKTLCCVSGSKEKTYLLTDESAEQMRKVLFVNNLSDPFGMLTQMQRDLDAYKTFFINVLGWTDGAFREGKAYPALGLFTDVSEDINDQMSMMMNGLRSLNDEYQEMKKKLEDAGIEPVKPSATDPENK